MATRRPSGADANGSTGSSGDRNRPPRGRHRAKGRYTMSPKALAARRANAKKSTGPASDAGKLISCGNALTHGMTAFKIGIVLPGEDAAAYHELEQAVFRHYIPLDPIGEWALRS